MARKIGLKKNKESEKNPDMINQLCPEIGRIGLDELDDVCNEVLSSIDRSDVDKLLAMEFLMDKGVTPEEYSKYYGVYQTNKTLVPIELPSLNRIAEDDVDWSYYRHRSEVKEYAPLKDAREYTLVLKIQLKDVAKPPMWREVEIPANMDFRSLHDIIQVVMDFEDCHLWQFNQKAYDNSLLIGGQDEDMDFASGVTHDPHETPVTMFLQNKKDKLEYVYDFGDDWIFTIEVKELLKKRSEYPVCRKYKGELNPIDDFGGVWSYISAREDLAVWNKLSKKQRKEHAEMHGFDSADEYIDFLTDHLINIEEVNDILTEIQSFLD